MSRVLRPLLVALAGLTLILALAPSAAATPWQPCGPHSLEEKTVRVFPRLPDAAGPSGDTSELQCGNRYYGLRRIEAEWPGATDREALDGAIGRTLVSGAAPTLDPRSGNHTYRSVDADVVVGPRGLVIAARPGTAPAR